MTYEDKVYAELIRQVSSYKRLKGDKRDMATSRLGMALMESQNARDPLTTIEAEALRYAEKIWGIGE